MSNEAALEGSASSAAPSSPAPQSSDAAPSAPAPAKPRPYFISLPVDWLFLSGFSLITVAAASILKANIDDDAFNEWALNAGIWANFAVWVINWPHFSATNHRLYGTRGNISQYPLTATVVPLVLLCAVVASFLRPSSFAPWFVKLYTIWSPYHFSGQTVGLSMLYARRGGFSVTGFERAMFSGFVFGTFVLGTARAETGVRTLSDRGVSYPSLNLPPQVATVANAGLLLCAAIFLAFVVRWSLRERRLPPPMVLILPLTQAIWFLPWFRNPASQAFVPMFHSLQYLFVAWFMAVADRMQKSGGKPFTLSELVLASSRWFAINFAGGAILFSLLPTLCVPLGFSLAFATPVVLSGVQLHHFFVDGVIWKLKSPRVRSPLMLGLPDILASAPPQRPTLSAVQA